MDRLKEIEARKAEIRKLLEGTGEVDIAEIEIELKSLENEKSNIEKRNELLKSVKTNAVEVKSIAKPDEGEEEKLPAEPKSEKRLKLFKNFGEQLTAIKRQATTGQVDERQSKLEREYRASGMSEGNGADGGFLVQTDFAGTMMDTAVNAGNILPLVDKYEITGNSNSVKWVDIDETSVDTTVFGGVQVYWASESATVTGSKPKLIERKAELEKLMGMAYATYELENDSAFVSELYTRAFTTAIQRELENTIINGVGAGKPLGFLKSSSLVSVAKESGQTAATILWENIVKMSNRALNFNTGKYVWLVHDDVQEQLDFLAFPVGVGGVPVYLPSSSAGTITTLKGKSVLTNDQCAALGTVGDINLVDLSQYMLITKGGVQADTSIHVQFLAAENCFRFIFRANGMPKKNSALTLKNSSNTRSPFVSLATRA